MKKTIGLLLSILIICSFISCGGNNADTSKLATKADNLSIEPGKTKLQDLIDNGYTYKWSDIIKPVKEIDGERFIPPSIYIMKDDEQYAIVGLINETSKKLDLEECTIGDTTIYSNYKGYHKFSGITVKGENFVGLKLDDIKAKITDKLIEEDEKSLIFNDGKVGYDFGFDDQKVLYKITFRINQNNTK